MNPPEAPVRVQTRRDDWLKDACATVLGSGHLRPAPGTWGSLVAVLVFTGVWWGAGAVGVPRWGVEGFTVAGILVACIVTVRIGKWAMVYFAGKDPSSFVLDEFAGQWVAVLALPLALGSPPAVFGYVVVGQFLLFRVFDIIKPAPARQVERLPAGWGILFDDLIAGVYANLVGQVIWRVWPLAVYLSPTAPT